MTEPKKENLFQKLFLKQWHPVPTVKSTLALFGVVGVIFLIIGIIISVFNSSIVETTISSYHSTCKGQLSADDTTNICEINFEITQKMEKPVYLFYELDNFYQNHRRYIKSQSAAQLSGESIDYTTADKYCDPITQNQDIATPLYAWTNHDEIEPDKRELLNPNDIASPCGLIALSYFNDKYKLQTDGGTAISIQENDISWPGDKGNKFKRSSDSNQKQWLDVEDEHFIVWMRTAGLPTFRKLWGRIEQNLDVGKYQLIVNNRYDVKRFDGTKSVVLSTAGPLGGQNEFLAIAFILVGIICLIIGLIFFMKMKLSKGEFGGYGNNKNK